MMKIFCFGDCNVDIVIPIREIPVKGGCSFSSHATINVGASAVNVAVTLYKLGFPTSIITKFGNDMFGYFVKTYLEGMGIDIKYLYPSNYDTGFTVGLIFPDGEKRWIAVRGDAADLHIGNDEIDQLDLCDVLYVSGVAVAEGKESRESAIRLAERVSQKGGKVFLDPNLRLPKWDIPDDIEDAFERIFKYVDVFLPNEKEIQLLGGTENIKNAAISILEEGVSTIWVKRGKQGCSYFAKEEYFHLPVSKVKAVDTSGAGDVFDGAIIYGTLSGFTPGKCGKFANTLASFTTQRYGTTKALPNIIELNKLINTFKGKKGGQ
ncbi:MAG: carbohydrate kinase family protein [Thermotogae bacterium]|nr:carbohydrate kinase family protein [Thermotogota bacterium]